MVLSSILLVYYLVVLSVVESGLLKHLIVTVDLSTSPFVNFCITCFSGLFFDVYMFGIALCS